MPLHHLGTTTSHNKKKNCVKLLQSYKCTAKNKTKKENTIKNIFLRFHGLSDHSHLIKILVLN